MASTTNLHLNMVDSPLTASFSEIPGVQVTLSIECYLDNVTLFLTADQFESLRKAINAKPTQATPMSDIFEPEAVA